MAMESVQVSAGVRLDVLIGANSKEPLLLKNPVLAASGTVGLESTGLLNVEALGGFVTASVTRYPRRGNPGPRVVETPSGILHATGLQNPGVHRLIKDQSPTWKRSTVPVIVSIAGDTAEDFAYLAGEIDGIPGLSGFELNLPGRYAGHGGTATEESAFIENLTYTVRSRTGLPILVKLPPDLWDICGAAGAAERGGADAISLINSPTGMKIDSWTGRSELGAFGAGLSGPAIRPLALWLVWLVSQTVSIPVVGIGGIASIEDTLEFIMAGASAVQVGTASFVDPKAAVEIVQRLPVEIEARGFHSVREIVGLAHPARLEADDN